jgi:hypothetical protein
LPRLVATNTLPASKYTTTLLRPCHAAAASFAWTVFTNLCLGCDSVTPIPGYCAGFCARSCPGYQELVIAGEHDEKVFLEDGKQLGGCLAACAKRKTGFGLGICFAREHVTVHRCLAIDNKRNWEAEDRKNRQRRTRDAASAR